MANNPVDSPFQVSDFDFIQEAIMEASILIDLLQVDEDSDRLTEAQLCEAAAIEMQFAWLVEQTHNLPDHEEVDSIRVDALLFVELQVQTERCLRFLRSLPDDVGSKALNDLLTQVKSELPEVLDLVSRSSAISHIVDETIKSLADAIRKDRRTVSGPAKFKIILESIEEWSRHQRRFVAPDQRLCVVFSPGNPAGVLVNSMTPGN